MAQSEFQYALFYENDHCTPLVEIFDTEEDACKLAVEVSLHTDGNVHGMQRSDGALEPARTWPMFNVMREEGYRKDLDYLRNARDNQPEMRTLKNPFTQEKIWVEKNGRTPDWVGERG